MAYVRLKELNIILNDYKKMKRFLTKERMLEKYIRNNKSSRSYFDRRINTIKKMMDNKLR